MFDLFYILAGDEDAEVQLYNLNGKSIPTLEENMTVLSGMTNWGLNFVKKTSKPGYGLVSWTGTEILPPTTAVP